MLKKIDASQLRPGMFIHELDCSWLDHPFLRNRFLLENHDEISRIHKAGIHGVVIDCARGLDVKEPGATPQDAELKTASLPVPVARPAPTAQASPARPAPAAQASPATRTTAPAPRRAPLAEEMQRAAQLRQQAASLVRTVMQDVRLGKAAEVARVAPVVENITASILRNPGAMIGLSHIKTKDDYTFLHSVSVCTLLVAFCGSRGMDEDTIYQAGLGGLLHDTGKALVPDGILNKPGRLTDEEFALVKKHPRDGWEILRRSPDIGPIPLDITLHHHERRDGSGYPDGLAAGAISELSEMAAIVDVYDAITSDRCYHKGMAPPDALRKLMEWSSNHFNPALVQEFIRCVGIYPVGTMVMLESGRLGVVVEAHENNLLTPKVHVFFNTHKNGYIQPAALDLARPLGHGGGDKIVRHEDPAKWGVQPARFLALA